MRYLSKTAALAAATCLTLAGAAFAEDPKPDAAAAHEEMDHGEMPEMSAEDKAMMEAWMKAGTPGEQHARMAKGAGDYKATVRTWMAPGEPQVSEATASREMIMDGRVLTERFEGDMMGMPFVGQSMFGYDNTRGKYWSTWVDSMSTGIMTSWGSWDEEKQAIVMEGEFMDPVSKQPLTMRTVSRHAADGTEVFEMWEPRGEGGEMVKTMEITYTKM